MDSTGGSSQRPARLRKPAAKVIDPNNDADPALKEHQKAVDEQNHQQTPEPSLDVLESVPQEERLTAISASPAPDSNDDNESVVIVALKSMYSANLLCEACSWSSQKNALQRRSS